ncbi:carbohydrate kinase family protein [Microbacterium sp. CFBP9034]|uniref:carbohydrate kinase family protein n=1 Tax=Microbacterium sp. CFBP9034 TaxID=3096540 RepID=UPI002A6A6D31|nr:PfkB family carbohydrate kinase [Microbacterium sp. CFBP9034]MDY0909822.1 PfkB family carbohydrate kinase [Microbacterium sp. CFBP9034]
MLVVIGDLVADLIVLGGAALERGTDNPAEVRLTRGGSAANVAVAAAPRHPVRFIGRVGDDTIGRALVGELEAAGVDVKVQRGGRTGAIVVLVDAVGERTMITDRGAAAELEGIDAAWLSTARWLHLPLYGFATPASGEAVTDAAAAVTRAGAPVSLDLSSVATLRALGAERLAALVRSVAPAVVFANEDEARVANELDLDVSGSVYVVKRGGEAVLVTSGGVTREVAVQRVDDVLDSTGAGDAFAAGYITAALGGADPQQSAHAGSELAMSALRRAGAL